MFYSGIKLFLHREANRVFRTLQRDHFELLKFFFFPSLLEGDATRHEKRT